MNFLIPKYSYGFQEEIIDLISIIKDINFFNI